mmetsp:Transcript_94026/g.166515  ORF Transcript_94026/g.166515 Transcript_94026/m.166515 type:complete len:363 (-) Transcript_94026:60-1148(-)
MSNSFAGMRFLGCPINRAAALSVRKDAAAIKSIRDGPEAQFLIVSSKKVLVTSDRPVRLVWKSLTDVCNADLAAADLSVYLGPMVAGDKKCEVFAAQANASALSSSGTAWLSGRELMLTDASDADVAIAGLALGMFGWHETALYDGRTGERTIPIEGGMKRQVEGGSGKTYPRTDPVAIGLIVSPDGTRCFLGRSHKYPPGMYTCLSGFVDQCESVEEAFTREVMEEAGLTLKSVHLVASQPWPIGRAGSCELMVGCKAVAASDLFQVNKAEIEDARWFTKAEVRKMLAQSLNNPYKAEAGTLFVPPPFAIAHHLIKSFVSASDEVADSRRQFWTALGVAASLGLAAGVGIMQLRRANGSRL